jgi:Transglycosylase SLT domain/SPOR domain
VLPGSLLLANAGDTASTGDFPATAPIRPKSRPAEPGTPDQRCTADRVYCITRATYVPDVCRMIEAVARKNALDPHFFARLLWRESLFDASAVSPAGAQGIAQFMPETAKLRGLEDAFNPAEALYVSATYLAELSRDYGNLGLAAAAYNGGENRLERFLAGNGSLPLETRAYVHAITGHSVETWRDAPPEALDLALDGEEAFQTACIARAENRSFREFREQLLPWGVILASNRTRDGAERQVSRLLNRHASVLRGETVAYTNKKMPGMGMHRPLITAQIGRSSRAEADAVCDRLKAVGGACIVLRN